MSSISPRKQSQPWVAKPEGVGNSRNFRSKRDLGGVIIAFANNGSEVIVLVAVAHFGLSPRGVHGPGRRVAPVVSF